MVPSSPVQCAGAVATFLAVVVALSKDSILAWWRKPSLDATCTNETPWTGRVPYHVTGGAGVLWTANSSWVRAKVENSGKTRAEKVQVYASNLAKLGADNKFQNISTFLPLDMK